MRANVHITTNKPELSAPRGIMTSANFLVCNEIRKYEDIIIECQMN